MKVKELVKALNEKIPPFLAEKWDNPGFMVGDPEHEITGVMIALDYHEDLLEEAMKRGCNFLFTHHPLIFKPLSRIDASDYTGGVVFSLIRNQVSLYCAHTNLDVLAGGVNDVLARKIGLEQIEILQPTGEFQEAPVGLGRFGRLSQTMSLKDFLGLVKSALGIESLSFTGDLERQIRTVAVCGGSGGSLVDLAAQKGCDLLLTGDVGYHTAQRAMRVGLAMVDGTHYYTESLCFSRMAEIVREIPGAEQVPVHILDRELNTFSSC